MVRQKIYEFRGKKYNVVAAHVCHNKKILFYRFTVYLIQYDNMYYSFISNFNSLKDAKAFFINEILNEQAQKYT